MKRLFDSVLALLMLAPASLIIFLACIAIRVETPGPALFHQERVGRYGRPFRIIKLRTMLIGTETRASHEIAHRRVTRVGRFLRRIKIDELPQVISVLLGDMSFVGPRPCLPVQSVLIEQRMRRGVYELRPGITGIAQISGIDMSNPELLAAIDAEYIRSRSFRGDLRIMAATILGHGNGDSVF